MEQNQFENLILERKEKLEANVKDHIKKQWGMSAFLVVISLAMSALGAYLLATGGYVLGAVLLAVGVGVVVAVSILHFRAIKKMKKMLADIQNLEVKK
jgi:hypothetical protein